jgi:hypothetical protein
MGPPALATASGSWRRPIPFFPYSGLLQKTLHFPITALLQRIQGDPRGNASGAGPTTCPNAACAQRPHARKEGEKGSCDQELVVVVVPALPTTGGAALSCSPETLSPPSKRQRETEGKEEGRVELRGEELRRRSSAHFSRR